MRALAGGDGEERELPGEPLEAERAALGDRQRVVQRVRIGREEARHLRRTLEIEFVVGREQRPRRLERVYLLATFAAFIVLAILERRLPGLEIHHLAGLSQRSPLLAATFAFALVSLAGVPPLSGFIAKFLVVLVAWHREQYLLLGFVIFAAVAALYYYLGPIKAMYWSEPLDETPIRLNRVTSGVLIALIVLIIVTGFWAPSVASMVNNAFLAEKRSAPSAPVAFVQH